MNDHTRAEREEAKKRLPKPIYDFLVSPTLTNIYVGIQKKHALDLRQLLIFTDIVNVTLMGLETESALETNLHQAMHELSNQGARELVADINDRVFKEAQRRLRENIREPSIWSEVKPELSEEEGAGKMHRELLDTMRDDDPELLAAYERDRIQAEEREAANKKELEEALAIAAKEPPASESDEDLDEEEEPKPADVQASPTEIALVPTIAAQKLATPTTAEQEDIKVTPQESGTQGVATQPPENPLTRKYPGENDPYKEPIE